MRIYGINIDALDLHGFDTVMDLSKERFMDIAEEQGNVWSLEGFEKDFNEDSLNQNNLFIRFYDSKSINVD
jgi:hypothetical protein